VTETPVHPDHADLPADARIWLDRHAAGDDTPWQDLGLRWITTGTEDSFFDTSYLTPDDLANPDIAANVTAIAETIALVTWLVEVDQKVIGYWRGPDGTPAATAPLVEHDTEGSFYLVGARSISEFLAQESAEYDDNWDEVVEACRAAGVTGELRDIYEWKNPQVEVDPRDFHEQRYELHRGQG
jgi:hypothetical protein